MPNMEGIKPFILGICGGSASGKTTIASTIVSKFKNSEVALLSMDSFYKVLNEEQHEAACKNEYNFDCPNAFDFDILQKTLIQLKDGRQGDIPVYDFVSHSRTTETETMKPAKIIIFEGILTFYDPHILKMLDMTVFVDADDDMRLTRRIRRDTAHRGRDLDGLLKQYKEFVQPSYHKYIEPLKEYADIIIPNGGDGCESIMEHIVQYLRDQLEKSN